MKLPRGVAGADIVKALERVGYEVTRRTGEHVRLTRRISTEHHITLPSRNPTRPGTLASDIAFHLRIADEELQRRLFR